MIAILLAAASAAVWGTADFAGGKAARRAPALAVAVLSQLASVPPLVVCLALTADGLPRPATLAWSAAGGLLAMIGLILLYRGLAAGAMAVVAPVTAVTAAVVPLVAGLLLDRPPGTVALIGVGCAVAAIALVSLVPGGTRTPVTPALVGLALTAGATFGLFFVLMSRAGTGTGLWPLAGARIGSLALGTVLLWRTGTTLRIPATGRYWTLAAGLLDMAANAFYLLATHTGLLSVVAPIASLYPASTLLLAVAVDQERVRPLQIAGLGLAATALVLVAS